MTTDAAAGTRSLDLSETALVGAWVDPGCGATQMVLVDALALVWWPVTTA
jgi:hypothetical protein